MAKDDPLAKKIRPFEKEALFSQKLATINCHVPIEVELKSIAYSGFDMGVLPPHFESLGFESLVRRLNGARKKKNNPNLPNQDCSPSSRRKKMKRTNSGISMWRGAGNRS